ncbi:MAG TPA: Abi-alpha family protein [Longimicrobiaceae bacterium]|jgi:hypothetical protein|nr:Abi-alpha family protein [Longimicrobiaceae bacterium]
MDELITAVSKVAGPNIVEKVYDDVLAPSLRQVGALSEDIVKALRLFTAPIQLVATYQDRLRVFLETTMAKVPEERQQAAPSFIAGPILEKIKYLDSNQHLWDLFSNLLARAIDRQRVGEAHPAFVHIISELSPDEALIVNYLAESALTVSRFASKRHRRQYGGFYEHRIVGLEQRLPLTHPDFLGAYLEHLLSLGLLGWRSRIPSRSRVVPTELDISTTKSIYLTKLGVLFVRACCKPPKA